jgi:hypothetical protein
LDPSDRIPDPVDIIERQVTPHWQADDLIAQSFCHRKHTRRQIGVRLVMVDRWRVVLTSCNTLGIERGHNLVARTAEGVTDQNREILVRTAVPRSGVLEAHAGNVTEKLSVSVGDSIAMLDTFFEVVYRH